MEAEYIARHELVADVTLNFDMLATVLQMQVELFNARELELAVDAGACLRTIILDVVVQIEQCVELVLALAFGVQVRIILACFLLNRRILEP